MCSELCKDFYVVYQLEMVAGEVESSCELVVTFFFFFFFFGLTLPNYRNKSGSAQRSPPSYQLLPPPLSSCIIKFLRTWQHVILTEMIIAMNKS